ncbi:hypothetical protein V1514DRAFT_328664 [Lipomyces japonicus]|uniref:uncharacterized protein n=1 Tax=Lipomyces japonicus TaxID=56871 RepID=UPI0034CEF37A
MLSDASNGLPPMRQMRLKVLYTFDNDQQTTCLARASTIHEVHVIHVSEHDLLGVIGLKPCLDAVASSSPELIADSSTDYAVYTVDFSEADEPLVGHGLLSWGLASSTDGDSTGGLSTQEKQVVCGRVCSNLLSVFACGVKETLEIKLRLTPVAGVTSNRFIRSMQLYTRLSNLIPAGFDPSGWSTFVSANPTLSELLTQPGNPDSKDGEDPYFGLPLELERLKKCRLKSTRTNSNPKKSRQVLDDVPASALNAFIAAAPNNNVSDTPSLPPAKKSRTTSSKPRKPKQIKPSDGVQEQIKQDGANKENISQNGDSQHKQANKIQSVTSPSSSTCSNSPYVDSLTLASSPPTFNSHHHHHHNRTILSPSQIIIPNSWAALNSDEFKNVASLSNSPSPAGTSFEDLMSASLNLDHADVLSDDTTMALANDFVQELYRLSDTMEIRTCENNNSTNSIISTEIDLAACITQDPSSTTSVGLQSEYLEDEVLKSSPSTSPSSLERAVPLQSVNNPDSATTSEPNFEAQSIAKNAQASTDNGNLSDKRSSRSNNQIYKKVRERIRDTLVQDLAAGKVPRYCENCGDIRTSTWRRIRAMTVDGQGKDMWLCNPCGIYFSKKRLMRPAYLWREGEQSTPAPINSSDAIDLDDVREPNPGYQNNAATVKRPLETTSPRLRHSTDENLESNDITAHAIHENCAINSPALSSPSNSSELPKKRKLQAYDEQSKPIEIII